MQDHWNIQHETVMEWDPLFSQVRTCKIQVSENKQSQKNVNGNDELRKL